jgi:hypothetical protein
MPTDGANKPRRETLLLKILVVGAVLVGAMAAIKQGTVLRDAGLLSSCKVATLNGRYDPTMMSCSKGRLDGFPDLTGKSCTLTTVRADQEYWRCDAPVVSSQSPNG